MPQNGSNNEQTAPGGLGCDVGVNEQPAEEIASKCGASAVPTSQASPRFLSGFRVQGSGFRVQGSGFRVQGSGFRVQGRPVVLVEDGEGRMNPNLG